MLNIDQHVRDYVLLGEGGHVHLADFGLALMMGKKRVTRTGVARFRGTEGPNRFGADPRSASATPIRPHRSVGRVGR